MAGMSQRVDGTLPTPPAQRQPDPDRLLEALDPEQRAVATTLDGPVRVLAGAGTGKTRAITHRIAYAVATGTMQSSEVLAVTFTTRAAGELRSRLSGLGAPGVQARTFHSAALRQARYFWPKVYGDDLPVLIGSKLALLGEAVGRNRLRASQADLRDLAGEVEWAKVSNVLPDRYAGLAVAAHRAVDGYDAATVGRIFHSYEEVKRERNRIDMEDVLLCAAAVLSDDERAAAQVRRQYRWIVVDEYQDVSPIQVALLDLWLGDGGQVCVVGDPAQTIYSFAGASADYLLTFPARHPGATTLTLSRNYRSTPQVLAVANRVMAGEIGSGAVRLRPTRADGAEVALTPYPDEVAEVAAVAAEIERLLSRGLAARDVAVLFRTNAMSEGFEEALSERAIPFVVRGVERFFERPEVRQAVALLKGAARGSVPMAGPSVETPPADTDEGRGAGTDRGQPETSTLASEVVDVLASLGWTREPPTSRGTVRDKWESLRALVGVAEELASVQPGLDLAGLVTELERRRDAQQAPLADGVTLATLHAAKGLEWPVVFLVGVNEGSMPIVYADTPAAIDEERRLLYVGITRAKDSLYVSWSAARSPGSRSQRQASRFLAGLVDREPVSGRGRRGGAGSRGGRSGKPHLATCRVCSRPLTEAKERKLGRCVTCESTYDETLFDALRGWRRQQADEQALPAYCIFTDATMTALAETRPTSLEALAAVPGIGPAKVSKYGDAIVALCTATDA